MKIAITGKPGSGKTTVCKILINELRKRGIPVEGFITEEIRDEKNQRTGFRIITTSGITAILADIYEKTEYTVGKYFVKVENIDKLIVPFLEKAFSDTRKLCIIDEVGKMELFSLSFCKVIEKAFNFSGSMIYTTPLFSEHPLVKKLKNNADYVFVVDKKLKNSEETARNILSLIQIFPVHV